MVINNSNEPVDVIKYSSINDVLDESAVMRFV
jgi:hypothetical protein